MSDVTAFVEALRSAGAHDPDVRVGIAPNPFAPMESIVKGAARDGSDWFFFVKDLGIDGPVSIVKAVSPEQAEEAQSLWQTLEKGAPSPPQQDKAQDSTIAPVGPSPTPDLPEKGADWAHHTLTHADDPEEIRRQEQEVDAELEMLRVAQERIEKSVRATPAGIPVHHLRFLQHVGYSTDDVLSGRVTMTQEHHARCQKWLSKGLRGEVQTFRKSIT